MIGLFPSGRPERAYERVVIWTVALAGFLLPLLEAVSVANISPDGGPPGSGRRSCAAALYVPALAPLGGAAGAVYRTNPFWTLIGVVLLALRYWRTDGDPAAADPLAAVRHGGARQPVDPGGPALAAGRPGQPAASRGGRRAVRAWPWSPRWGRCSGRCSTPGYSASTSPCGARRAPCPAGIDRRRASPSLAVLAGAADQPGRAGRRGRGGRAWPPAAAARPFGAVWSTPPTGGCSARGWPATPASIGSARA